MVLTYETLYEQHSKLIDNFARVVQQRDDLLEACEDYVLHIDEMRHAWQHDGSVRGTKMHGLAVALNNRPGDRILAAIASANGEAVTP